MLNLLNAVYMFVTCNILLPLLDIHPFYLAIHPEMFVKNLKYMGLGMLCIIIVMAVIICVVLVLNKVTAKKNSDEENK